MPPPACGTRHVPPLHYFFRHNDAPQGVPQSIPRDQYTMDSHDAHEPGPNPHGIEADVAPAESASVDTQVPSLIGSSGPEVDVSAR